MSIGRQRHHVTWSKREAIDDGAGNVEGAFVDQFACPAAFNWLAGGEGVIGQRLAGTQPLVMRVRASNLTRQIGADWRAQDDLSLKFYAVRSVKPDETERWLDVMVEEGVAP